MATIGSVISAVPNRPGFDVYCMNPQPFDSTPNIVVLTKPASGGDLEARVSFRADYAFRDSRIAANRREFGASSQQASVFYQGYNGNLLEYRINRTGGRSLVNVNNVPENTSHNVIAPAMGTSLATVMSGEDGQTVYLFYQAEDNRIYYVWQKSFAQWSLPSLVTNQSTQTATTLSAFAWAESDPKALTVVDCVCVAFNHAPGRYQVYMRRELRRPPGDPPSNLRPNFELVVDYCGPPTRGPFSAAYVGAPIEKIGDHWQCSSPGQYKFYTQLLQEPSRIWEGTAADVDSVYGLLDYSVVVSSTPKLRTPARGTSITTVYDPPKREETLADGRLTVIYTSPEGLLAFREISLTPTTPQPTPYPKPALKADGVYRIAQSDSSATLRMNADRSVVLSQTAEDSDTDFSQLWLVEAIDRASGIYTMRNVATGAQMPGDSPEQDSTLYSDAQSSYHSSADEANEWQFSTVPGDPASFTISHKETQTSLEDALFSGGESAVPAAPSTSGTGTGWNLEPVSIQPPAIQKLVDNIPNVTTGWSKNKSTYLDNHYIVLPPDKWEEIWQASELEKYQWRAEIFDCDDFALVFKAQVSLWAYDNIKTPKVAVFCGTVVARSRKGDAGHCFNFNLSHDLKTVTFFEPQQGKFKQDLIKTYEPTFGFW